MDNGSDDISSYPLASAASEITDCDDSAEEEMEVLRNFIETFERLPELWNPRDPSYKNKIQRNIALDKLVAIYVKIKPRATRTSVKKKINTLRTNYRKQLNRVMTSMRSGMSPEEVYKPTSWVFYALQFLDGLEQPLSTNVKREYESVNNGADHDILREHSPSTIASSSSYLSAITSPPPPPPPKRRALGHLAIKNEALRKACSYAEQPVEPQTGIPTIAKVWGEKLLTLDAQQKLLAEKAINDILFEASLGTLHRNSITINEDEER